MTPDQEELAFGYYFDGLLLDITKPNHPVEVSIRTDNKVLLVNVGGTCVLRICGIVDNVKVIS